MQDYEGEDECDSNKIDVRRNLLNDYSGEDKYHDESLSQKDIHCENQFSSMSNV